jgi:trehalose 6-phosphate phosphatase
MRVDDLARLVAEPGRAALLFDVDGTLAPIVPDPAAATVPEETRRELRRLATRYALVGCVSGRPGEVAREIVGVSELEYLGEHGLELDPAATRWAPRIHAFADGVDWPVERKPLSIAFHYRTAEDPDAARAALEPVAAAALEEGFRTRWGRMVLEVLPPLEATKGTAVRRLLEQRHLRRALYAGDDATDLDAFVALDGLDLAIRVAVISTEGPERLGRLADLRVSSPAALTELLAQL